MYNLNVAHYLDLDDDSPIGLVIDGERVWYTQNDEPVPVEYYDYIIQSIGLECDDDGLVYIQLEILPPTEE